ncbi:13327_t:CDS:2, partial [Acaulospora colombiana]
SEPTTPGHTRPFSTTIFLVELTRVLLLHAHPDDFHLGSPALFDADSQFYSGHYDVPLGEILERHQRVQLDDTTSLNGVLQFRRDLENVRDVHSTILRKEMDVERSSTARLPGYDDRASGSTESELTEKIQRRWRRRERKWEVDLFYGRGAPDREEQGILTQSSDGPGRNDNAPVYYGPGSNNMERWNEGGFIQISD